MLDEYDEAERIRVTAYHLWEQAGCPEGRAEEFWALAREIETGPTAVAASAESTSKGPTETGPDRASGSV